MVLLHAFPLTGEMFEPQWTALGDRARFIVPDLRGFGGSDTVPSPSEMGTMADDVLSLLDHLGVDSAVVGGVSMGGYASLALLRNDPGRVRALLLADTQTSADDAPARERREVTARDFLARGPTATRYCHSGRTPGRRCFEIGCRRNPGRKCRRRWMKFPRPIAVDNQDRERSTASTASLPTP